MIIESMAREIKLLFGYLKFVLFMEVIIRRAFYFG